MKGIGTLILALPLCAAVACKGGSGAEGVAGPYHISFDAAGTDGAAFPAMSDMIDSIEYVRLEYAPDMPVVAIVHLKK